MKLTVIDEQHLRTYAKENPADLALVITVDAEQAHAADNLIAEVLTVHLFLESGSPATPTTCATWSGRPIRTQLRYLPTGTAPGRTLIMPR
jgi:hypothetical protein